MAETDCTNEVMRHWATKKNGTGCGLKKSTAASEGLTLMKEEYGHEPAETHP